VDVFGEEQHGHCVLIAPDRFVTFDDLTSAAGAYPLHRRQPVSHMVLDQPAPRRPVQSAYDSSISSSSCHGAANGFEEGRMAS